MILDIRTYFIILLLSATCASLNTNIWIEVCLILLLSILQIVSGKKAFMPKLLLLYIVLLVFQFVIIPVSPEIVIMLLSMFVVNLRGFFPVIMCIVLIYKTTMVSQLIATMTKMKVSKGVVITVAITTRYIPTLIEEWRHIREAMSVRRVTSGIRNPLKKIGKGLECYLVPFFMQALKTSDELSASAITRGIDNPAIPTCRQYRPMGIIDYAVILIAITMTVLCIIARYVI